jgi:hypothetical protein
MEQRTNFIALTAYVPKIPIKILIGQEGKDTEDLASDLRETLTLAGFKANADAGPWGINRDPTLLTTTKLDNTNDSDLLFLHYSTNDRPHIVTTLAQRLPSGLLMPVNVGSNDVEVYSALSHCLRKVGIKCEWQRDSVNVHPNECLILVEVK